MPNAEPPPIADQMVVEPTSVWAKMANVFVTPAEVFDEVKSSPINSSNWLVPLVVNIVFGIIFIMTMYSQPAVIQQLRQPNEQRLEKLVKEGKLTQKAADQQLAVIDRFMSPGFLKVIGVLSILFMSPAMLFFVAMLFWLVSTFAFRAHFEFMKGVEAVALTSMIGALGMILQTLLLRIYGSMYMIVGPVLLLNHFDPLKPLHILIQSINLMTIWYLAVLAIALARFSGTRFYKAAFWPFGVWLLIIACRLAFVYLMLKLGGK